MAKYHYYMSSRKEDKHEIPRKEFVKLLGESNHCVDQIKLVEGMYMDVANYDRAESRIKNAQRQAGGTIWLCGPYTLYLERQR